MQEYDESSSEGYRAFRRGDYELAGRLVREMVASDDEFYAIARQFNVRLTRIRVYEAPLSPYLRHYEIPAYLESAKYGVDVRFVDAARIRELVDSTGISDYVLFDDKRVTALIYDENPIHKLVEARLVEDRELLRQYIDVTDSLLALSVPITDTDVCHLLRQQEVTDA